MIIYLLVWIAMHNHQRRPSDISWRSKGNFHLKWILNTISVVHSYTNNPLDDLPPEATHTHLFLLHCQTNYLDIKLNEESFFEFLCGFVNYVRCRPACIIILCQFADYSFVKCKWNCVPNIYKKDYKLFFCIIPLHQISAR